MTLERKLKHLGTRIQIFCLSEWSTFLVSTIGALLYVIGVVGFTIPYHFPDAGVMGIAIIFKYTVGFSPAIFTLIANIVLLIWGGRQLSKRFLAWTVYNAVLVSFLLQVFSSVQFPHVNDMILVSIAGGILKGVGVGMVFRAGVSMGGMDIVVAVLRKKLGIEVGQVSFYINMLILAASVGIVGLEKMLFGFVGSYVSGQVTDSVMTSFDKQRLIFIITDEENEVVSFIRDQLHRGATLLYGKGCYTGEDRPTLMCLLTAKQSMELKRHLAKFHPKSFMVVTEASEVLGNGFKCWKHI